MNSLVRKCESQTTKGNWPILGAFILEINFILQAEVFATMTIKYTTSFLTKLEDLIAESDYILRYEKGQFKSGYCLLKEQKIIIINKFYTTEGKINTLLEILRTVELDKTKFTEKSLALFENLNQPETIWNTVKQTDRSKWVIKTGIPSVNVS